MASSHQSKRTGTSGSSHQLSNMTNSDHLAEFTCLKAKLTFHDAETKVKAELEKIKTLKELEILSAKTEILNITEPFSLSTQDEVEKLPVSDTKRYTQNYASSQYLNHNDVKPFVQPPGNTNTSATHLDPSVSPFVPPVSNVMSDRISAPVENINCDPNLQQSVIQSQVNTAESLVDQVTLNRLSSPEPNIFYGDLIQYPSKKTSFKTQTLEISLRMTDFTLSILKDTLAVQSNKLLRTTFCVLQITLKRKLKNSSMKNMGILLF